MSESEHELKPSDWFDYWANKPGLVRDARGRAHARILERRLLAPFERIVDGINQLLTRKGNR